MNQPLCGRLMASMQQKVMRRHLARMTVQTTPLHFRCLPRELQRS